MGGFISIFIVLAALVTMVGVMYMVLTEKHTDESKINYVQSPYAAKPVKPAAPVSPYADEQGPETPAVPVVEADLSPEKVDEAANNLSDSIAEAAGHAIATPAGAAAEVVDTSTAEEKTDSAAAAASSPVEGPSDAADQPKA